MSDFSNHMENLFPVPISVYDLGEPKKEELKFILNLKRRKNAGNLATEDYYVLQKKQLSTLCKKISTALSEHFYTVYKPKNHLSLRITQSWCNYTEEKQFHHEHHHPNSIISGVYYPQATHPEDKIYFENPNSQSVFDIPSEDYNIWNSPSWWLPVQTGKLLLFPSNLKHRVESLDFRDNTRISLSFNTFFQGTVGDESRLTALTL